MIDDTLALSPGDSVVLKVPEQSVVIVDQAHQGFSRARTLRRESGTDWQDIRGQEGDGLEGEDDYIVAARRRDRAPGEARLPRRLGQACDRGASVR